MNLKRHWVGYAWAIGASAACTFVGLVLYPRFDLVNVAMVYLLAVVIIALRFSRGPAIAASVLCVAAFDFVFVPPRGTFTVDDIQYLLTFAIMLAVGLIISRLVKSVRRQAAAAVVVHNHPSGDPAPSGEDLRITGELAAAGRLLDIDLLDHLVIGHGRWVSLRALGAL